MFSKLHLLEENDNIFLYDIYGNKLEYKVYNQYVAEKQDTSYLESSNNIELTLITCSNINNSKKLIIKAKAK